MAQSKLKQCNSITIVCALWHHWYNGRNGIVHWWNSKPSYVDIKPNEMLHLDALHLSTWCNVTMLKREVNCTLLHSQLAIDWPLKLLQWVFWHLSNRCNVLTLNFAIVRLAQLMLPWQYYRYRFLSWGLTLILQMTLNNFCLSTISCLDMNMFVYI